MQDLTGRTAVVTGGTDGMGAATARALRARGADVIILGRSQEKADAIVAGDAALAQPGRLRAIVTDLGLMHAARTAAGDVHDAFPRIDFLLNAAGILITRTAHTTEGIELDFAVSYLGRFAFVEELARLGALTPYTRMITIAASSRTVPSFARMEFSDAAEVAARTGMKSHGQAQLANDLWTAQASGRYGVTAMGYGPGAVDTNIRRELPRLVRALVSPFFARSTRSADDVASDLVSLFTDPAIERGRSIFADRKGTFPAAEYIADPSRQRDLLRVSLEMSAPSSRVGDAEAA